MGPDVAGPWPRREACLSTRTPHSRGKARRVGLHPGGGSPGTDPAAPRPDSQAPELQEASFCGGSLSCEAQGTRLQPGIPPLQFPGAGWTPLRQVRVPRVKGSPPALLGLVLASRMPQAPVILVIRLLRAKAWPSVPTDVTRDSVSVC